ncbi:protein Lines homolog 1 [Alosa sapidissima]|uniref:protein Lines homolog 1 n=1 Tax=Alosa sapidissima TaxID=34773 RepID=UPI001C090F69|nr:protein Lines homolog 1 [Alosa sapidissima]
MDVISLVLQDAYGRVQLGGLPSKDFRELAPVISASISSPSVTSRLSPPSIESDKSYQKEKEIISHCHGNVVLQVTPLALSLVEKMSVKLLDHKSPQDLRLYIQSLFRVLHEEFNFISSTLSLFGNSNRLFSHLAAKCLSSLLICDLQSSNARGIVMQRMCEEAFQMHSSCYKLDAAIWSLTAVIKEVLKGNTGHKSEHIEILLTRTDSGITSWYSSLLLAEDIRNAGDWETTLTTFMDLLEALTAARFRLGTCFSSQRLLFLQAPVLLQLLDTRVDYYVKKHVLLLLKKTLLQRTGEDWLSGAPFPTAHGDPYLAEDMGALTESVLEAMDCGWLSHVPVSASPSFFGGTNQSCSEERADDVMLRAVSLVLLKSLEHQTQSAHSKSGSQTIHTLRHLTKLLLFLNQHCVQLRQSCHPCFCVSLVFADQDDDMVEAARALIILHTHQKSLGVLSAASSCEKGLNPHCHFVLLLRVLMFDHSVLLDFLISSETCFLEYIVRYLKLLRDDWEGFCNSCQLIEGQDVQRQGRGWRKNSSQTSAMHDRSTVSEMRECHSGDSPSNACSGPHACSRLVDYGSSEDSGEEKEEVDVCAGTPDTGRKVPAGSHRSEGDRQCVSLPDSKASLEPSKQVALVKCTQTSLAQKVVLCLMELRTVVSRLQRKNLFPYNPASLIKLLALIEEKVD